MRRPWLVLVVMVVVAPFAASAAGTPQQAPKRGGTIVVGRPAFSEPACLNPFTCTDMGDSALTQVLEGAFEVGPDLVPRPDLVSDVALIQAQLRRAGVDVVPTFATGGAFFDQILPSGDFDLAAFLGGGAGRTSGWKSFYGCGGQNNYGSYGQRLVTANLDQADRILDARRQGVVLNRADRQLATDVPVIPLYQIPLVLVFRQTLKNVNVSPNNPFWNAENWWLER